MAFFLSATGRYKTETSIANRRLPVARFRATIRNYSKNEPEWERRMTTRTEGELLTRVGPGTPMGKMLREYWIPAALSSELTANGPPIRLMLLGEQLIAFR